MMSTSGSSYKCEECDMSFNSERKLEEHYKYTKYRRKGYCWQ
jgi:transposase-like protein